MSCRYLIRLKTRRLHGHLAVHHPTRLFVTRHHRFRRHQPRTTSRRLVLVRSHRRRVMRHVNPNTGCVNAILARCCVRNRRDTLQVFRRSTRRQHNRTTSRLRASHSRHRRSRSSPESHRRTTHRRHHSHTRSRRIRTTEATRRGLRSHRRRLGIIRRRVNIRAQARASRWHIFLRTEAIRTARCMAVGAR